MKWIKFNATHIQRYGKFLKVHGLNKLIQIYKRKTYILQRQTFMRHHFSLILSENISSVGLDICGQSYICLIANDIIDLTNLTWIALKPSQPYKNQLIN